LGSLAEYPAIRAVAADGATYRTFDDFFALPMQRTNLFLGQVWLMYGWVRLLTGETPPPLILDSMAAAEPVPLLLIAAGNEEFEAAYSELFAERLGARASVWVVPDAGHTQGFTLARAEYEPRLFDFFAAALAE
ncbi:MAG: hypothetical protein JW910_20745, partial [Anaerolineae bacterium]|nr:hypothetical protein [Anaerolineae bacterium]